jgi:hypothetical protein
MSDEKFRRSDDDSAEAGAPAWTTIDAPPDDNAARHRQPQFSIAHVMLWTFFSALVMGVYHYATQMYGMQAQSAAQGAGWLILRFLWQAAAAAAISGCTIFLVRRFKGLKFPVQPGEWLLVTQSLVSLAELAGAVVRASVAKLPWESQNTLVRGAMCGDAAVTFVGYLLPALFYCERGAWRRFFVLAAILAALSAAAQIRFALSDRSLTDGPRWLLMLMLAASVVLFIIPVIHDLRRKMPRGWLHWWGVAMFVLMNGYQAMFIAIALSR